MGEALGLTWGDMLLPSQHRAADCVVLLLGKTKRREGQRDRVVIQHGGVVRFFGGVPAHDALVARRGCASATCPMPPFASGSTGPPRPLATPRGFFRAHSCRRGGATRLALRGLAVSDIMAFGRWSSMQSCLLYVQKAQVTRSRHPASLCNNQFNRQLAIARLGARVFSMLELETCR